MHLCKRDGPQHIRFSSHPGEEALSDRHILLKKGRFFWGQVAPPSETLFIALLLPVFFCSSRRSSKISQVLVQKKHSWHRVKYFLCQLLNVPEALFHYKTVITVSHKIVSFFRTNNWCDLEVFLTLHNYSILSTLRLMGNTHRPIAYWWAAWG